MRLLGADGAVPGQMENVSISGAFVRTVWSGALGGRIELELLRTDPAGLLSPRLAGYVSRKTGDGAAIEWCELAPPAVRGLLSWAEPQAERINRTQTAPRAQFAAQRRPARALGSPAAEPSTRVPS